MKLDNCIPCFLLLAFTLSGCAELYKKSGLDSVVDTGAIDSVVETSSIATAIPNGGDSDFDVSGAVAAGTDLYKAATLSDEEVLGVARSAIQHIDSNHTLAPASSAHTKRLARLAAPHLNEDGLHINVEVYDDPSVNAFCLADGSIRFYSGLLDLMTDNEIRGVLGHEIGHIKLEHSKKQLQRAHATAAAIKTGVSAAKTGGNALAASLIAKIAETILDAQFSQSDERESDTYSLSFLAKNNYPLTGLQSALHKLSLEEQSYSFLSSHPSPGERIEALKPQIAAFGRMLDTPADTKLANSSPAATRTARTTIDASESREAVVPEARVDITSTSAVQAVLATESATTPPKPSIPSQVKSNQPTDAIYTSKDILRVHGNARAGWYVLSQAFESKFDAELQALDIRSVATDYTIIKLAKGQHTTYHLLIGPFYKQAYADKNFSELMKDGVIDTSASTHFLNGKKRKAPVVKAAG